MSELVLTQKRGHIVEIVLNRPDKRNAINWPVMEQLDAAVDAVEKLDGARVVFVRGEGKAFSAGLDLTGFAEIIERFGENWRQNLFPLTAAFQAVTNKFERCSLPLIALLHGHAIGLGCELALACDFRIAAEGVKIGLPESKLGLIPDVGGTTRLTQLVGPARAKELIMTGRNIDLADAERWGLVNYVVPENQLMVKAEALADEIAQAAPLAVSYTKRVVDGITDTARGLQLEAWAQSVLMRSEDFETGAQSALTRQPPVWKGK